MAVRILTAVCEKCEREIGPAHAGAGPIVCTSCILFGGPARPAPVSRKIKLSTRQKPKRNPKPEPLARTDRQRASGACLIYAIQMRPGVVKVGRTTNWAVRKHSYTNGFDDVIKRSALFRIIDDHEILADIETALLQSLPHSRAKGYEWLFADFDEVAEHTDAFLRSNGIMFERE